MDLGPHRHDLLFLGVSLACRQSLPCKLFRLRPILCVHVSAVSAIYVSTAFTFSSTSAVTPFVRELIFILDTPAGEPPPPGTPQATESYVFCIISRTLRHRPPYDQSPSPDDPLHSFGVRPRAPCR